MSMTYQILDREIMAKTIHDKRKDNDYEKTVKIGNSLFASATLMCIEVKVSELLSQEFRSSVKHDTRKNKK